MHNDCCVYHFLWCCRAFLEVKHIEKLREHIKRVMGKVSEHAEGVITRNGHCANFMSTYLKFKVYSYISI